MVLPVRGDEAGGRGGEPGTAAMTAACVLVRGHVAMCEAEGLETALLCCVCENLKDCDRTVD